jgi:hypothetical protein
LDNEPSFILTFDHPRWLGFEWDYGVNDVQWSHYALLFVVCMLCHGELYRRRPTDTRWLTEFYLCMSIGGAFGGLFVTLVATQYFDDYHEWLMALVLFALLASHVLFRSSLPLAGLGGRTMRIGGLATATGMVA